MKCSELNTILTDIAHKYPQAEFIYANDVGVSFFPFPDMSIRTMIASINETMYGSVIRYEYGIFEEE